MFHEDSSPIPSSKQQENLNSFPAKTSFILGIVAGVLSLGTVGFLVLLSMVLRG